MDLVEDMSGTGDLRDNCILIEQLMILVVAWEMFGGQAEEVLANI